MEGFENDDPTVDMFWSVLESFSAEERCQFLRFSCGRERLPNNRDFYLVIARLYLLLLLLFVVVCCCCCAVCCCVCCCLLLLFSLIIVIHAKDVLPRASTCSSMFKLPSYSSKEIMWEKILFAITSCIDIDNDFRVYT